MEARQQRGLALVQSGKRSRIKPLAGSTWLVPSATNNAGGYVVDADKGTCTCPDHEDRNVRCKHIWAVAYFRQEIELLDGATAVAAGFDVREVSADKAYLSNEILTAIEAVGAVPYIPFKSNSRGRGGSDAWRRLWHTFEARNDEFLAHYHKRSNVETTFSMVKQKFVSTLNRIAIWRWLGVGRWHGDDANPIRLPDDMSLSHHTPSSSNAASVLCP
jgi:hypothetical protein